MAVVQDVRPPTLAQQQPSKHLTPDNNKVCNKPMPPCSAQVVPRMHLTNAAVSGELVSNGSILVQRPANLLGSATCSQQQRQPIHSTFLAQHKKQQQNQ
jgi:hypothetical protein